MSDKASRLKTLTRHVKAATGDSNKSQWSKIFTTTDATDATVDDEFGDYTNLFFGGDSHISQSVMGSPMNQRIQWNDRRVFKHCSNRTNTEILGRHTRFGQGNWVRFVRLLLKPHISFRNRCWLNRSFCRWLMYLVDPKCLLVTNPSN